MWSSLYIYIYNWRRTRKWRGTCTSIYTYPYIISNEKHVYREQFFFFSCSPLPPPSRVVRVTSAKSKVFRRLLSSAKTKDEPLGRTRDRNTVYNRVQTREWAIRARDEYQKPLYYIQRRRWWAAAEGDSKFGLTTPGHLYTRPYCVYSSIYYMHACTRPDCFNINICKYYTGGHGRLKARRAVVGRESAVVCNEFRFFLLVG